MKILNKEQLLEKAKTVFSIYPAAKEFHFTADGQAFTEQSNAANHAKTLEVKDTVLITKSMAASGSIDVPMNPKIEKVEGGAKNEFQKLGTKSESGLGNAGEAAEKAALAAKHEELSGKKPAANISLDKLKAKVQELEDAKAAEAAEAAKSAGSSEGKTENPE